MAEEKHTPETELKIAHIVAIMRERWFGDKDRRALAAQWKCTEGWVSEIAAWARNRRLAEVTDHDNIKATGGAALERIITDAMSSDDPKDRANAIKAIDVWSSVMGAGAAKKIEMSGAVGLDELDALRQAAEQNECSSPEQSKPKDGGGQNS